MFSTPPDSSTAPKNLPAKRIRSPFQEPAHSPRRAENQPITSNGSPPKTDISAVIPTPATQQLTQAHESLISRGRKHEAVTEAQESIERFYGIPNGSSALAEFFKHHSFQDLHKDLSLESQSAERSPIAEHNKPRFDSNAMSNFSVHQRFYNTSFSLPTAQRDPTPPIQSNSLVFGSSAITAPLLTPNLLEKPFLRVFGSSSPEKTAQVSLAQSKNSPVMFGVNSMPNISKFVSSSVPAFNSQPKSAPSESNPHDNSELVASESNMLVFGSPAIIPPRPTHSLLQTPFARVFGSPQVSSVVQHLPVEVGIVNTPNVSRIPPKSPSVDSLSEGFKADLVDDLEVFESSLAASSLPFNDLDFDEDMREEDLDLEL